MTHKEVALEILKLVDTSGQPIDPTAALVHATLYLAQQQRTANMIALFGAEWTGDGQRLHLKERSARTALHAAIKDLLP